jgi:hypothetical protein
VSAASSAGSPVVTQFEPETRPGQLGPGVTARIGLLPALKEIKMKMIFLTLLLLATAAPAFADYSDDCNAGVIKDVAQAAKRKMSASQQEEIKNLGAKLCLEKSLTEIHKELHEKKSKFISDGVKLSASFCGVDPEAIGRGRECARDKGEMLAAMRDQNDLGVDIANEEKRIRRIAKEYDALQLSRPLPNRKIDPIAEKKRVAAAAIAKVKSDILESMKDPDSVKFRRLSTSSDGSMICGEVNSKNAMGGYVGFKKFVNIQDKAVDFYFYEDAGDNKMAETCEAQAGK